MEEIFLEKNRQYVEVMEKITRRYNEKKAGKEVEELSHVSRNIKKELSQATLDGAGCCCFSVTFDWFIACPRMLDQKERAAVEWLDISANLLVDVWWIIQFNRLK